MEEKRIIKNLDALTEDFIPSRVVHRDGQLKTIRDCLEPILKGLPPINSFLYGKPGTGKTCIAKYVTQKLKEQASVLRAYINCWDTPSSFKTLYSILDQFGLTLSIHRKGMPADELLDLLNKKLEENPAVIILDEVDKLEDDKILYTLVNIKNICLILIANSETALYKTDQRVRSRLASAENIEFPQYNSREIFEILKDRAEWGLVPGVIKNTQLERIASASGNDARVAIQTLRIIAQDAENKDIEKIQDSVIERFIQKNWPEEKINQHQKLILDILKSGDMDSGKLFKELQNISQKQGIKIITDRTFRRYLEKLVRYNHVKPSGTGRWRTYSLAD